MAINPFRNQCPDTLSWHRHDYKSSCSVQVFKRILKNKLLDNFVNTP